MQKIGMSLFVGAVLLGAVACDDGVIDKAESAWDCNTVCEAVDECTDVDKSECQEDCTANAEDDGFDMTLEECAECIKPNDSCSDRVVECSDECAGVVVLSTT